MTVMDNPFANTPDRWRKIKQIAEEIDRNNAFLVVNYHNNNFSNSDFLDYDKDYIRIIEILKRKNAQFMTMSEAYMHIVAQNN